MTVKTEGLDLSNEVYSLIRQKSPQKVQTAPIYHTNQAAKRWDEKKAIKYIYVKWQNDRKAKRVISIFAMPSFLTSVISHEYASANISSCVPLT